MSHLIAGRAQMGTSLALAWRWPRSYWPRGQAREARSDWRAAELHAIAIALGAGAVLLLPSLWLLHGAFRRAAAEVAR